MLVFAIMVWWIGLPTRALSPKVVEFWRRAMGGRYFFLRAAVVAVGAAILAALPATAQISRSQNSNCSSTNVACQCSYKCCGEERCDGSICNQCVIDCVQRRQPTDERSISLQSRCESIMTRGFRRP